ncbi:unnamed protein product [Allacma fusca]|uniref:Uncharacterized protein n=1 Tax=Allacma fusca TaxID=39272 RepID=A0A8J2LM77_9HEXA|nr:unnamed protein product [Allacma fusca]
MENVSKQTISLGGSGISALDFGLTNGKSKCAYESTSPSSSSDQEQNGEIGRNSFLERSRNYSSEKLTPPFSDDENGSSEGMRSESFNEDTLAFSGLEVEKSRLETTNNCSVSEGEMSVDMFAPTPVASKVNGMRLEAEEVLVPPTQQDDLSAAEIDELSVVLHDSSFDEALDKSQSAPLSDTHTGAVGSNPVNLNLTGQSDSDFDVIVPATQPVEEPSFDSDNPSFIECSDEENTIPSFDENSDTCKAESKQALYNSTFTVSPSPMKVASRPFFKKKEIKNIEEENVTYVMDISEHGAPRGNVTYLKDLPQDSPICLNPSDADVDNVLVVECAEFGEVSKETIDAISKVSCGISPTLHDESTSTVSDAHAVTQPILIPDTTDSLVAEISIPAPNQVTISAEGQPNPKQLATVQECEPVSEQLLIPESVLGVLRNLEPDADQLLPVSELVRTTLANSNSPVILSSESKTDQPEKPSNESCKRQTQPVSSSPRKGKKLYAEPTPPVLKSVPAPKTPKSYSSSSESEEETRAVVPAKKTGTPARFKCYNKRGRDSKADREALFETENPRPTTSAALVRHNARGRKASPKPKEPVKKTLKKRILLSKPEPKLVPEKKKAKVTTERRRLRLPSKNQNKGDSVSENDDEATSVEVPNAVPEVTSEVPISGPVVVPEDESLGPEQTVEPPSCDPVLPPEAPPSKKIHVRKNRINKIANLLEHPAASSDNLPNLPEENADKISNVACENPSLREASDEQVLEFTQAENMPVLENQSLETRLELPEKEMPNLQRVTRNRPEPVSQQEEVNPSIVIKKRTRLNAVQPEIIQEPKSKPGPKSRKVKPTPSSEKINSEPIIVLKQISLPSNPIINSDFNSTNSNAISDAQLNSNVMQNSTQNEIHDTSSMRCSPRKGRNRKIIATITLDSETESSDSEYEQDEMVKRRAKKAKIDKPNKSKAKNKKVPTAGNNRSPFIMPPPTPMKSSKIADEPDAPLRKMDGETSPAKKRAKRNTAKKVSQDAPAPPKYDNVRRSGRERKPRKLADGFVPLYFS